MRKRIVFIIILCIFFSLTKIYADAEIYSIQLGLYKNEANADKLINKMLQKDIKAFKISTSSHIVFYGIYSSKADALEELKNIRKYANGAFVTKFNKKQESIYLKSKEFEKRSHEDDNKNININKDVDLIDEVDSLYNSKGQNNQQITINKIDDNNLEYMYRVMNDIELRGVNGESKWYFEVDKGLEVKDFKLNLFVRVNELIRTDISYATIYMNNTPIKSMNFETPNNQLLSSWEVDIPTHLINRGYNELKILTYSRISDSPCEDDKNIANWVIIDESTNYVIQYDRKYYSEKISNFPKPFIGIHADDDKGVAVIVPDDYTDDEMSAALTLIAHMKDSNLGYDTSTRLMVSNDNIEIFDSLIYIGDYGSIPKELEKLINDAGDINKKNVHIYRRYLNDLNKPVLMIISDNGKSLITAVKALKNNNLKGQMTSSYISLDEDFDVDIKTKEENDDYIYFKDLGLNGIEVKGRNQQFTSVGLRIPFNEILANESNVNLNIRYSDNLDFEKSMVSVYINGVPVGSHKLERDKRDLDSIKFYIPEALRQNSYYDIRIVFELIPDGIINCEKYLASVPWAYIQKDSSFFAPSIENTLMLLDNFPYPFSREDDLDRTTIVLPDKPTKEDLELAGMLVELTGIGAKKNEGVIRVTKGNMLSNKHYKDNLIIFGTPEENSGIRTINNNLWFKYNEKFDSVLSNEKIELLPEFARSATFIELKPSTYDNKKGILSITSLDKKSIIDATKYLYKKNLSFLTGDAVIISKNGDLNTFRFQKDTERPKVSTSILQSRNMRNYIIFSGSFIILMLISLGLYSIKNRRDKDK
ncbi:cellulose biosynthesis cyclic di-GMP-binding regulatory protein BcsB [Wukongibacter sp. M2B1]|uniref:cellulose biosynthesis cyclic di-GMP-binding regulatory protein BcsB n=1 Tax=Wukongibacter sp. M2B1 TaxID=3088895 RepID=UPI003D7A30FC